jgi:hypothetical protein
MECDAERWRTVSLCSRPGWARRPTATRVPGGRLPCPGCQLDHDRCSVSRLHSLTQPYFETDFLIHSRASSLAPTAPPAELELDMKGGLS